MAIELDKSYINSIGHVEPKFKVIFRIEIPKSSFTYVNAINKIVELNEIYDFDWIAVDRGYGETQIELLHKYGIENPQSGLRDKVVGYQFGQKLDVRDPHTMQKDRKPLKPFMVNNSVIIFEKEKIVLDPSDKLLIEQLESYRIKNISSTGIPTYTDENEHAVDALNLCLLIFEQKYGRLFRNVISSKILPIDDFANDRGELVASRDIRYSNNKKESSMIFSLKSDEKKYDRTSNMSKYYGRSTNNSYRNISRSSF